MSKEIKHLIPLFLTDPQIAGSKKSLQSSELSAAYIGTHPKNEMEITFPRKVKVYDSDIVWSGDCWICSRQLKHYPSFTRNGLKISLYSFAYVMGEGQNRYISYLDDLYEDGKGHKKVKVRWFYHNEEVNVQIPQLKVEPEEVVITAREQVITAGSIIGVAVVLNPNDYQKYLQLHLGHYSSRVHMCHREFRNNKVEHFSLNLIRGYNNQAILNHLVSQKKVNVDSLSKQDDDCINEDPDKQGTMKVVNFKENRTLESNQNKKSEPIHQRLRIKLSKKVDFSINLAGPFQASLIVGDNIEFLCQDSGIRGCWFRCKILKVSKKLLKLQYYDIDNVDGPGNLEEWVPVSRVADPDKLGMRHPGRHTIRPWPQEDSSDYALQIGAPIDVWWCDGWWEAVIIGFDTSGGDTIQVYSPGENRILSFDKNYTRVSRDWIDGKWVEVKVNDDIFSSISSIWSAKPKTPMGSHLADASGSISGRKIYTSSRVGASQHGKKKKLGSASPGVPKSVDGLKTKKKKVSFRC